MSLDDRLERAAKAIAEGEVVDWDEIESRADDPLEAARLHELRIIAGIATFHRNNVRPPLETAETRDSAGDHWGPLQLIRRIGHGAFGEVYEAYDPHLERTVALKLLSETDAALESRSPETIKEGTLLARVRHAHVVTVFGASRTDGRTGVWMEFIRGRTLAEALAVDGVMSATQTAEVGRDVCRGLAAVHEAGVIHRDVKAQNVMRDESGRIVLMDFGAGFDRGGSIAQPMAGTPMYLAPELLSGESATPKSDIYSVGVLLYFLLTGRYPVAGNSIAALKRAHADRHMVPLRQARPDVPRGLSSIVDRALDLDPARRFATASENGSRPRSIREATGRSGADWDGRSDRRRRNRSLGDRPLADLRASCDLRAAGCCPGRHLRESHRPISVRHHRLASA
jgi:serine/threonine-protein kinase